MDFKLPKKTREEIYEQMEKIKKRLYTLATLDPEQITDLNDFQNKQRSCQHSIEEHLHRIRKALNL